MARSTFGNEITQLSVTKDAGNADALVVAPSAPVPLYDAPGGTLVTDFLLYNNATSSYSTTVTSITATATGHLPAFQGPDAVAVLYDVDGHALFPQGGGGSGSGGTSDWSTIANKPAVIAAGATQVAARTAVNAADDAVVVKLTGAQTLDGVKTFSAKPAVPDASFAIAKTTGLQTALDSKLTASQQTDVIANYNNTNQIRPLVAIESGDPIPDGLLDGSAIFTLVPASTAIAISLKTPRVITTTDGTSFATASITPAIGDLLHVTSRITTGGVPAPAPSSVTGGGVTWVLVDDQVSSNTSTLDLVYRANSGSPTAGAITVAFGSTVEAASLTLVTFGTPTTVVQSQSVTSSSANPAISLSSVLATNYVVVFFSTQASSSFPTGATGFTELGTAEGVTGPSLGVTAFYKATGQNTWSASTGTNLSQKNLIMLEVSAP